MRSSYRRIFFVTSVVLLLILVVAGQKTATSAPIPGAAGDGIVNPGSGTYAANINIEIPDYYGLQPDLSLVYNSTLTPGFPGVGWTLTGESLVERSSPGGGAPKYDSTDVFALDGAQLLPCTTLGGTHCTRHQSYQRIQQDSANNTWYVWEKDGTKKTYSALYCAIEPCAGAGFNQIFRWALRTVEDTHCIIVNHNYWCDPGQNCYLDNIAYNGVAIKLWRELRPDRSSFANGRYVGSTHYRLKTIEITRGGQRIRAYKLTYTMAGSCIDVTQSGTANGTNIQLFQCNTTAAQGWRLVPVGSYYQLVNQNSGKCMDVASSGTADGTNIQLWTCNGTGAQLFSRESVGDYTKLVNQNSGKCVDVRFSGTADGTNIQLWTCNNSAAQLFWMDELHGNSGYYQLASKTAAVTHASLLAAVTEYGTDVALDTNGNIIAGTALPPWEINYSRGLHPGQGFAAEDWNNYIGGWSPEFVRDYFVDVNGDAKTDLVRTWKCAGPCPNGGAPGVYAEVSLSNGTGFTYGISNSRVGDWNTDWPHSFADVNGDGKADLIRMWQDGSAAKAQVRLSNGTAYPSDASNNVVGGWKPEWHRDHFVDVNGDGKADLVRIWNCASPYATTCPNGGAPGVYAEVSLSIGTGFDYAAATNRRISSTWNTSWPVYFADVNGDGKADLVRIWQSNEGARAQVRLSNGTAYPSDVSNEVVGAWSANWLDHFVDVNGDGKSDLVRIVHCTAICPPGFPAGVYAEVNLSDGRRFNYSNRTYQSNIWTTDWPFYFADVNGDGKDDLIRIWDGGAGNARADIRLFYNDTYEIAYSNLPAGGWNTSWSNNFVDVNGDGKADLVRIWQRNATDAWARVSLAGNGTTPPDLLTSMTNGVGGTTAIEYKPSSAWLSQYAPRGGVFPTVSKVTVADGRGLAGETTYSYRDAKYSVADKGFVGFAYQKAVVDSQGTYIEINNRQTIYSVGQPDSIYTKNSAGQIYSYTTYTYTEAGNGSSIPYSSQIAESSSYECNLTALCRQSRSTFTYDTYGNQARLVYHGDTALTGDEYVKQVSYTYNTADYIVDTPRSEQVYSGTTVPVPGGGGAAAREVIYFYDGAADSATAPVDGDLTRTDYWDNQNDRYVTASQSRYDAYGNVVAITDARGYTSTTTFDSTYHFFPVQTCNALSQCITQGWDTALGLLTSVTDANNATTSYIYDMLGRSTSVTDPAGNITTSQYLNIGDPNSQRVRVTRPDASADGLWTDTYTDGLGRTYKVVREGPSSGVTYVQEIQYSDTSDRPRRTSLPYQSGATPLWEIYEHDGAGRITKTTHPDGKFATIAYTNDQSGRPYIITRDELGKETASWADTTNRVTAVREKNGTDYYSTNYAYDVMGNLKTVVDANGGTASSYTYDSLGRRLSMTDIDMGTWTYTYDAGGLVLSQTDAKGQTITQTYDELGRVTSRTAAGQTSNWHYDEPGYGASTGRLTRVVYPEGSESHTYNQLGQETSTTLTIGATSKTLAKTYDALGRVSALTYPDSETATYSYNAAGNLRSVGGYVDEMVWSPGGQLEQMTYANGTVSDFTYDTNRLWLAAATVKKGTATLYTASYGYYDNGMVQTMTQGTPNPLTTTYTYDDLNRLLAVTGAQSQTFTYDKVGNILTNSLVGNYAYDDPAHKHAVTAAGTATYSYDANGNMLAGDGKTITWDAQNRIASVAQGGATTSFTYDEAERRIKKVSGANTTLYFGSLLEEFNGRSTQFYYAGPILVAQKDADGIKRWYHADRLGSIRLMTDANGAMANSYDYKPFGEKQSVSATVRNERGFTGHVEDAETGLIYMAARYYDAKLGRFLSADTVVGNVYNPQDLNRYSYVRNNPINNVDPTGHEPRIVGWRTVTRWRNVTDYVWERYSYTYSYWREVTYWQHIWVGGPLGPMRADGVKGYWIHRPVHTWVRVVAVGTGLRKVARVRREYYEVDVPIWGGGGLNVRRPNRPPNANGPYRGSPSGGADPTEHSLKTQTYHPRNGNKPRPETGLEEKKPSCLKPISTSSGTWGSTQGCFGAWEWLGVAGWKKGELGGKFTGLTLDTDRERVDCSISWLCPPIYTREKMDVLSGEGKISVTSRDATLGVNLLSTTFETGIMVGDDHYGVEVEVGAKWEIGFSDGKVKLPGVSFGLTW